MKKYIFLSFALIALFFSCTQQELEDDPILSVSDYPVFYATFESSDEPATRTYADPLHRIRWHEGDRVSVFNGNTTNLEYMFEGETGDSTGVFRIVGEGNRSSVRTRSTSYKYAVYPYDEACALSEDGTLTVTFPAEQSYADNSFGPWDNTMISISEDDTLFFRNAGGYLILKLYGDTTQVTSITLKGNKDEPICGKGYVTVSPDGIPSVRMSEDGSSTLTLLCEEPVPLNASAQKYKEFWFVVPPVTFTEGFTIVIEDSEGRRMTKSTDRTVTVKRNERFRMTPLNVPALPAKQFVKFEDPNFKAYCVANFDTNWDGGIDLEEALQVTKIYLYSPKITSLGGIEYFVNLTNLSCSNQQLDSLDISNNISLTALECSNNQLTNLNISNNTSLTSLRCGKNQLTNLDVSNNISLTALECSNNQLTSLDVSNNTKLTSLSCGRNQLTSLDISKNTNLTSLSCYENLLTTLDISKNSCLTSLSCDNNQLTNLNISNNTSLTSLRCGKNQLTSLDVSNNTSLTVLWCYNNQLTNLDVSNNTSLTALECDNNQLTSLDVSNNTSLSRLDCPNNQLTSLDVSGCTYLESLNCDYNQLTVIDLSPCPFVSFTGDNNPWVTIWRRMGQRELWTYGPVSFIEPSLPEAVDLGLSVNWGSFNLWATKPEEYGDYYAWGEVSAFGDYDPENENLAHGKNKNNEYTKYDFTWETYKWGNGERWPGEGLFITKYCNDSSFGLDGFTDDLLTLEPDDDAAAWLLGDGWRMPTVEEWWELILSCSWEALEINGVWGLRATSKVEGFTDRWIFLPFAGRMRQHGDLDLDDGGLSPHGIGNYWSSSLVDALDPECLNPLSACRFRFDDRLDTHGNLGVGGMSGEALRFEGCSIRPVKAKENQEEEY